MDRKKNKKKFVEWLNAQGATGSRVCSCGRKFGTFSERVAHVRFDHTDPDRIVCPVSACGQIYDNKSGFMFHFNKYHPKDDYLLKEPPGPIPAHGDPKMICATCKKSFPTATSLHLHTVKAHGRPASVQERTPVGVF